MSNASSRPANSGPSQDTHHPPAPEAEDADTAGAPHAEPPALATPAPTGGPRRGSADPAAGRLVGIDLARGLAVLGMFVVHVGLGWSLADGSNALYPIAAGRSAILFALLAGVSIALLSGGAAPKTGAAMGVALWRVIVRGLLLLPLGTALTMMGTSVSVILAYYAVFFLLTAPLLEERWPIVAGAAVVLGVVGPVASFYLRSLIVDQGPLSGLVATVNAYDPFVHYANDGLINFVLTGTYPALTWMPFVMAGLAIGRLRLDSAKVCWRLVAVGTVVAVGAYTAAWLALDVLGGAERLADSTNPATGAAYGAQAVAHARFEGLPGVVPTSDWAWLLTAAPHSGTPLEIFGSGGVAIAVLGACLLVTRAWPWGRRWVLSPVTAVGALALTTYVGHIVFMWVADAGYLDGTVVAFLADNQAYAVLGGALVLASLWRRLVGRGPLEWPLHVVSLGVAKRIP
ncbi:DUF418 domain-containing protein [Salinactinospora qingdaonensis]|uniref:Heparan-alpha-glucosaminide N-acetyltransferase domain-containing protein n=1 Tax=Salinactinospora qingdaonensis TaxID=702744 RepID=A0ABP7GKZ3_9ACTN